MGTKVQSEMYFSGPAYYDNAINGTRNLRHETRTSNSGQFYDLSLMNSSVAVYSLYDKQQMRQTILNHEVTFRHQLHELHRIYKIQRELMNGIQCEIQYENKNMFSSRILDYDSKITPLLKDIHAVDFNLMKGTNMYSSSVPIQNGVIFEECKSYESRSKKLQRRLFDHDIRADNYIDLEDDNVAETNLLSVKHEDTRVWGHDLNEPIKVNEASSSDSIEILGNLRCSKREIQRQVSSVASNSNIQIPPKELLQNRRDRGFCLNRLPSENERRRKELSPYNSESEKNSGNSSAVHGSTLFGSLLIEPRKTHEPLKLPPFAFETHKRQTLFGVDISEKPASHMSQFPVHEGSCFDPPTPSLNRTRMQHHAFSGSFQLTPARSVLSYKNGITSLSESNKSRFCLNTEQSKPEQLQGGLHWLRKPMFSAETSKAREVSDKTNIGFFHDHLQSVNRNDVRPSIRKILGVPIFDMCPPSKPSSINNDNFKKVGSLNSELDLESVPVQSVEQIEREDPVIDKDLNDCTTRIIHHIDLNMCLTEDDAPSAPSSIDIKKIATEINLDASVLETEQQPLEAQFKEPYESLQEKLVVSLEETVKDAAEAIVAISFKDTICGESQAPPSDSLHWFANIISSHNGDLQNESGGGPSCEKVIPQKVDYFEFMTLRMTETKEEDHYHKPEAIETQKIEEETLPKRPRRGQARRGRHRKDFQRDILPGLASLSKHEVTEDLQTIEDIIRTTGGTWQSSLTKKKAARGNSGRGRRRTGASAPIPSARAICVSPIKQDNHSNEKAGVEEGSLTGWGKRTRRPPRQRYPIVNPLLVK